MRVFPDTNVLVAAFIARGLCADLFREILKRHQLVVGEVVLDELQRALFTKVKVPKSGVKRIVNFLRRWEVVAYPEAPLEVEIGDQSDKWVLASATKAGADLFVTGDIEIDIEILTLKKIEGVRIVTPRDCWMLLRGK